MVAFQSCHCTMSQISAELVKVENACKCSLKATAFCVLAVAAASFGGIASVGRGGFRGNQNKELKSFISTSQDFLASAALLKPCSKGFKPFELIESNKVTIATCEKLCSIESRDLPLIMRTIFYLPPLIGTQKFPFARRRLHSH